MTTKKAGNFTHKSMAEHQEVGSVARFPMGDGTCTKVPTILQLKKGTGHTVEVGPPGNIKVRPYCHNYHSPCVTVRLTHFAHMLKALPASCSTREVMQAISNAQTEILKAKFPNYKPTDIQFSPTPVTVVASTPNIPTEIVLVDLPGMLASMDPKAAAVKEMVLEQIISKNTLIVAAGKSDNDDNIDEGLYLARDQSVDPLGTRTLRAYTFWKQARDVRTDEIKSEMSTKSGNQRPHVLDLKRDANGDLVPDHVPGVPQECQGTGALVARLATQLGPLVRTTKDDLERQFKELETSIEERLEQIGRKAPGDDWQMLEERLRPLKNILKNVSSKIVKVMMIFTTILAREKGYEDAHCTHHQATERLSTCLYVYTSRTS